VTARPTRILGWTAAALGAAALLSGAAVALTVTRRSAPEPLVLTLAAVPPAGLTVAAVADPAPAVQDNAPDLADPLPTTEDTLPGLPQTGTAPPRPELAPITQPAPKTPMLADLSLPEPVPEPDPQPMVKPKPRPQKPDPRPEPEDQPKPKAEAPKEKRTASAGAAAPVAGAKATGGSTMPPAAYAKAVMKKVRATRKQSGAGKGTVVVGFSIAADGGLAGVRVLQGSGNDALDRVALDHIRRSAPFPAPPEGAGRNYSFEFVGK
jgi:protein TonB